MSVVKVSFKHLVHTLRRILKVAELRTVLTRHLCKDLVCHILRQSYTPSVGERNHTHTFGVVGRINFFPIVCNLAVTSRCMLALEIKVKVGDKIGAFLSGANRLSKSLHCGINVTGLEFTEITLKLSILFILRLNEVSGVAPVGRAVGVNNFLYTFPTTCTSMVVDFLLYGFDRRGGINKFLFELLTTGARIVHEGSCGSGGTAMLADGGRVSLS